MITLTLTAHCLVCDWTGTTDGAADKHTKTTKHATATSYVDAAGSTKATLNVMAPK